MNTDIALRDETIVKLTDRVVELEELAEVQAEQLTRAVTKVRKLTAANLQGLQYKQGIWSDETFGDHGNPLGTLHHLAKEVQEAIAEPHDLEEYGDCLTLLIDAARRAGFTAGDLVQESFRKLEVNRGRNWGEPDANGCIEHIRGVEI